MRDKTFTAVPAACGLAQLIVRAAIGGHDVRQFMQACLFAFADAAPVVRADLDPALRSVGAAASPSTHHGYRAGVRPERSREPVHLLDGMDVNCTMLKTYYAVILYQHFAGQPADRQARCQLRVIRGFL